MPAEALGGALHGDRVRVRVTRGDLHDYRPSADVEEILDRGGGEGGYTGNLERVGKAWFVRPDSPLLPERLRLRLGTVAGRGRGQDPLPGGEPAGASTRPWLWRPTSWARGTTPATTW